MNGSISERLLQETLKLQEMVANGQLSGSQASEVLRAANARGVTVEEVMADRSSKEDEIQRANEVVQLLRESGIVTAEDMNKADLLAGQLHLSLGEVLMTTGILDKKMLQSAVQGKSLIEDGILNTQQVTACLHYSNKTGVDFADALREVSGPSDKCRRSA